MPELPEVESLRLGLVSRITGSTIKKIEIRNPKLVSGKGTTRVASKSKVNEFINSLTDKKILSIERRAKNLIFHFKDNQAMLVHLKMTGQLIFKDKKNSKTFFGGHPIEESTVNLPNKHTYIIFQLNNGTLYYNDVRQFGYCLYIKDFKNSKTEHFADIGLEPFDQNFTADYFAEKLKSFSAPIKKVLLDQKIVVGVGNIYCDECLWHSSILPDRPANNLNKKESNLLHKNIILILNKAIKEGGSSVANYLLSDGSRGNYAHHHKAYKKQGQKCQFPKCKGVIQKTDLAGRGTHFCNIHQK